MISFNPYNIYVILNGAPTYGNSLSCTYLGYWVEVVLWIFIFVRFYRTLEYFLKYSIVVRFEIFILVLAILSISCCLCILIDSQSAMKGMFNIMLRMNTSWTGIACNMVWYVLRTAKGVSDSIPDLGSSASS